jgi:hypothetical protein
MKLNLREILTHDNPRKAQLEPLVEALRHENIDNAGAKARRYETGSDAFLDNPIGARVTADFAQHIIRNILMGTGSKKLQAYLTERLAGHTLIDLGGEAAGINGERTHSMAYWAQHAGLASYIGVDLFAKGRANPRLISDPFTDVADDTDRAAFPKLDIQVVRADMLDFLMRLPDGTTEKGFDFSMCGIDEIVLRHKAEYMRAVTEEITRTMRIGGLLVGGCTFEFTNWNRLTDRLAFIPISVIDKTKPDFFGAYLIERIK